MVMRQPIGGSKSDLRKQAIAMRQAGALHNEVALALNLPRSTVYSWTKNIVLEKRAQQEIALRLYAKQMTLVGNLAALKKEKSQKRSDDLRNFAHTAVSEVVLDQGHKQVLCAVMFWCEGSKDTNHGLRFTNSDPHLISTFMRLLRGGFAVDETRLRALVHLHDYHDADKQLVFWSEISGIPITQFYKPFIKPHTAKRMHIDYPGCINIRYPDSRLAQYLAMIYDEFGKCV